MSKINFRDKRVLIIGAAHSGVAAAKALKKAGAKVRVTESRKSVVTQKAKAELKAYGIETELGGAPLNRLRETDLVVPSPGVPPKNRLLVQAAVAKIPVLSEVEIAWHLSSIPMIAVTGTNGKTTTVTLIGEILKAAGKSAVTAGNIGYPLSQAVTEAGDSSYLVVELSSFQLTFTRFFRPFIAVLLNITPDHYDWHGDYGTYEAAKYKIFANQSVSDWAVVSGDDAAVKTDKIRAKKLYFSSRRRVRGSYCENGMLVGTGNKILGPRQEIFIRGEHNLENCLAAATVGSILELDPKLVFNVFKRFKGVEHRLELVDEFKGISYFNDSKATNPEAVMKSVNAFNQPVILLAGGRNKGNSFKKLAQNIKNKVRLSVLFGEAANDIAGDFSAEGISTKIVSSLEEAVTFARKSARTGDIVLLSPACASYDMFKNYRQRGESFKKAVKTLKN
ncbi:MAG TPA: UDP-N-acetylmuramoyl-L-alanine--D-glutamate ligase [Actinobacteria bacterium]|nr:UDP-N-acetylmuramoyl-L-alanine--D-glutamate ligase [Actinomycetes bacterium]HEX21518.1 UDP-N-acetylmuramoyl-L-alanine--D-glutamate ligase [Actinomycetota bacterium]